MAHQATTDPARLAARLDRVLALAERPGTEGEAEAAVQAAARLLALNPSAFRALLAGQNLPAPGSFAEPPPPPWRETVAACLARPGCLRPWEIGFLRDLQQWGRRLSPKQRSIVNEIAARVGVTAEAAA